MRPTIHGNPRTSHSEEEQAQRDMAERGRRLMAMKNRQMAAVRVGQKAAFAAARPTLKDEEV